MINLNKGATNSIVLRLSDKVTIQNPIYLFELTSVQSNQVFYFTPQDQSITNRFNSFKVFEISGTDEDISLTASIPHIQLTYGGSYLYKVYQATNYSLQPTQVILDSGLAIFRNGEYDNFFFELGDDLEDEIFDLYDTILDFEYNDNEIFEIFDPEFYEMLRALITETGEWLMTEADEYIEY